VIAAGHTHELDLGLAGGKAFVGIASVGFDSEANRIANQAPRRLGNLVYLYGALSALARWRPVSFEIELEPPGGERHRFTGYTVGVCNSTSYGGGMRAAPDALLDDGALDVVVLEEVSKLRFLGGVLPKVFRGTHTREPTVKSFRAREVAISADRPLTVYADGDPIAELPAQVKVLPAAVRVLVPADSAVGGGSAPFKGGVGPEQAATQR
jgi:diacylglycerol kinase family enzyme